MKKVRTRAGKAGLPPGSLVLVSGQPPPGTAMRLFVFDAEAAAEPPLPSLTDFTDPDPERQVAWLDIDGLGSEAFLAQVGERFKLHPLLLEDILNTDHRPKVEEYQDTLFVVAKMLKPGMEPGGIDQEQVCFVLRKGLLLSFQERPGDVLDPIRERIRKDLGRVRRSGSDYLLYSLLDVIVDQYFAIVDDLGKRIEELERKVMARPGSSDLAAIQGLRSALIAVNRHVTPMRELAGRLNTIQSPLIDKSTRRYINDLQDHAVYIAESIGVFRELLTSVENTYHAGLNARMAQVMKLLTIISTIFIPLTFIVGVYGMNFRHMPELGWHWGYPAVMALMALIAGAMLLAFQRKGWL